jgi:hypothetical protein
MGEALSPGVKWQGREADHSPPASAEVKKLWIYTSEFLATDPEVPGSIPGATRFSEK